MAFLSAATVKSSNNKFKAQALVQCGQIDHRLNLIEIMSVSPNTALQLNCFYPVFKESFGQAKCIFCDELTVNLTNVCQTLTPPASPCLASLITVTV